MATKILELKVVWDILWQEYQVEYWENNNLIESKTYYTPNVDDARMTALVIKSEEAKNYKSISIKDYTERIFG